MNLIISSLSDVNHRHAEDTIVMNQHIMAECHLTLKVARDPRDRYAATAALNAAFKRIQLAHSLKLLKDDPIRSSQICQQIVETQPEEYPCQIRGQVTSSSVVIQPNSSKSMFLKLLKMATFQ